jgi:putative transposase
LLALSRWLGTPRSEGRRGHCWGRTIGKIGFHAGKVAVDRPRVRDLVGQELVLPSWDRAVAEDWLGKWAMLGAFDASHQRGGYHRRTLRCAPAGSLSVDRGEGL